MIEATEKQLDLLWHTLGLNPGCRTGNRNHFLTSPGYDDANNLDVLVEAGLMTRGKAPAFSDANDVVYSFATPAKSPSAMFAITRTKTGLLVDLCCPNTELASGFIRMTISPAPGSMTTQVTPAGRLIWSQRVAR